MRIPLSLFLVPTEGFHEAFRIFDRFLSKRLEEIMVISAIVTSHVMSWAWIRKRTWQAGVSL